MYPLSPNTIYEFDMKKSKWFRKPTCNEDKMCTVNYEIVQFNTQTCTSQLICEKPKNILCGSFGFEMDVNNKTTEICDGNVLFTERLISTGSAKFKFWFLKDSLFDLKCFFWCTNSGELPKQPEKSELTDLILSLVKC